MASGLFSSSGSFSNTLSFLKKMQSGGLLVDLDTFAQLAVSALSAATPVDSGLTAASWSYEIVTEPNRVQIIWSNSHEEDGVNIAALIQYGHGTGTGGYITGFDYVNPAMQPIFEQIIEDVWKKVSTA